jgi:glycosyltransferase A (GT-A) superfamily protein (DUF2064 family)
MKKGRFSEAQIVAILQQQASEQTVAQIVREHGLSEATFYAWKSKYAGASVAELTRSICSEIVRKKSGDAFSNKPRIRGCRVRMSCPLGPGA